MKTYYTVEISAENQEQADVILNALLAKKLVTGGQFLRSPARFLWKGETVDMDYITITSFTTEKNKAAVIKEVMRASKEEVPMIRFTVFESNPELLKWIDQVLG